VKKTHCLSQCQAIQRLVRSSHTLVKWILNNFWSTESIFNWFSVFLKTWNVIFRLMKRVIRSDKPITSVYPVKSQRCYFGAEPRCHICDIGRERVKSLNQHLKIQTFCTYLSVRWCIHFCQNLYEILLTPKISVSSSDVFALTCLFTKKKTLKQMSIHFCRILNYIHFLQHLKLQQGTLTFCTKLVRSLDRPTLKTTVHLTSSF
jgi:hypothetical protein